MVAAEASAATCGVATEVEARCRADGVGRKWRRDDVDTEFEKRDVTYVAEAGGAAVETVQTL